MKRRKLDYGMSSGRQETFRLRGVVYREPLKDYNEKLNFITLQLEDLPL